MLARNYLLLVLCVVSFTILGWSLYVSKAQEHSTTHEICVAVNNLNGVITQTLERSKTNLDRLAYYRHHPKERNEQLREINRTESLFRPRTCR